ncbi:11867_t:CDS:10 [Ambispora leptoticha]|uniref:11867_t:CDS:1 n=1 Tax=Ambispora leptoticha TaxID=144679 RepID=A0A9N8ZUE8_9GLOM|nr:11867_t:CDS:10 [Ambispora leptoticha]
MATLQTLNGVLLITNTANASGTSDLANKFARLATYLPLGSYVIYTALETYAYSLGPDTTGMNTFYNTTVITPQDNYTCLISAPISLGLTCNDDQKSALIVALCIGFFLSLFLSFVKRIPAGGTPPLSERKLIVNGTERKRLRSGVLYADGADYYMDIGNFLVWGHAMLSVVAFATLTLFSSSVSQCLFPNVKSWIFVLTQMLGLILCSLIGMFWIRDESLGIESTVYKTIVTPAPSTAPATQQSLSVPIASTTVAHLEIVEDSTKSNNTQTDTETIYTKVTSGILARFGKEFDWALKAQIMGRRDRDAAEIVVRETGIDLSVDDYLRERDVEQARLFPHCKVLPGVMRLVKHLKSHNIPIVVATSSRRVNFNQKTINHQELFNFFIGVVCGNDPGIKNGKPAPDLFLAAHKLLGNPPREQCLVFEDAATGVEAAKNAGMHVVWVPHPRVLEAHPEDIGATQILTSLEQFDPIKFGLPPFDDEL